MTQEISRLTAVGAHGIMLVCHQMPVHARCGKRPSQLCGQYELTPGLHFRVDRVNALGGMGSYYDVAGAYAAVFSRHGAGIAIVNPCHARMLEDLALASAATNWAATPAGQQPTCPDCGQPASSELAGPPHEWECRNEACPEFGQPIRDDEPAMPEGTPPS